MWRQGSGEVSAISFDQRQPEEVIGQGRIFAHQPQVAPQRAAVNTAPEWVAAVFDGTDLFDVRNEVGEPTQKPAGINNTEWRILVRFCVMGQTWQEIAKAYSVTPAQARFFAEDAARRLYPERCMVAQARALGHQGVAITSDAPIVAACETFYSAIGSPFGATPEGLTSFVSALANDPVVVRFMRDHVANGGVRVNG
jgi:hypothetical protein